MSGAGFVSGFIAKGFVLLGWLVKSLREIREFFALIMMSGNPVSVSQLKGQCYLFCHLLEWRRNIFVSTDRIVKVMVRFFRTTTQELVLVTVSLATDGQD